MPNTEKLPQALNGEPVTADAIPAAVTAGTLRYDDGSVQIFNHDGSTTYTENGTATGLRFTEVNNGSRFDGRFQ
jgi:hypothetical protein